MDKLNVGNYVYADDFYGQIVEIEGEVAYVEFNTGNGGGCLPFHLNELKLANPPKKEVFLKLTEDEFNMLVKKLNWMRCVVRDTNLKYEDYCNGNCGNNCNRKDLCNFESWLKSKIVL